MAPTSSPIPPARGRGPAMTASAMSAVRIASVMEWRLLFVPVCIVILAAGCGSLRPSGAHGVRVIVLGVDGMDPQFVQQHWDVLPNLDRLRRGGDFKPLAT